MKKSFVAILLFIVLFCACIQPAIAEEWICPTCNNEASGNFCNNCGAAKPIIENWICPSCGNEASHNYCNLCGLPRPINKASDDNSSISYSIPDSTPIPTATDESSYIATDSEDTIKVTLISGKEVSIRKTTKEALDSYESFMDGYKEALEKMGSGDFTGYLSFWAEYEDFLDKISKLEQEFTPDESLYYIDVTARILEKMY